MKEIPSDKRLWHHVGSLCSQNCNTMSLTQLQSSWDNIVEIYLEIMLFSRLASWLPVDSAVLTRVTDSRWRWAFVTFFRDPLLVPLKTGRFPLPIWWKPTHGGQVQRVRETNKTKQTRVNISLWLGLWRVSEAVATELRSGVLAGFRLLQPWEWREPQAHVWQCVWPFMGESPIFHQFRWCILQNHLILNRYSYNNWISEPNQ